MDRDWRYYLLKSGLPLEQEVKECFVSKGCTVWEDNTYIKKDENNLEKEFSFDILANYWGGSCFYFLIECKYRDLNKNTKWFFLPDTYAYQDEISADEFLHLNDIFVNKRYKFIDVPKVEKENIGPLCLKGVEVIENDCIETHIWRAINQVSYAFMEKYIEGIDSQLYTEMFYDTAFINVPIIITNADLYLINQDASMNDINNAKDITEISQKYDFLCYRNIASRDLINHNKELLLNYFDSNKKEYAQKHINRLEDIDHFIDNISKSPKVILLMQHTQDHTTYDKLFDFINKLIKDTHPLSQPRETPQYILDVNKKLQEIIERKSQNRNNH
jgi:hypothetical protein